MKIDKSQPRCAEFVFIYPRLQKGEMIFDGKPIPGIFTVDNLALRFTANIVHPDNLSRGDYVCLLSEEQIRAILEEGEGGKPFFTEEGIREIFSFEVFRKCPMSRGGKRKLLIRLVNRKLTSAIGYEDILFVTVQLVRFGIIVDKIHRPLHNKDSSILCSVQ